MCDRSWHKLSLSKIYGIVIHSFCKERDGQTLNEAFCCYTDTLFWTHFIYFLITLIQCYYIYHFLNRLPNKEQHTYAHTYAYIFILRSFFHFLKWFKLGKHLTIYMCLCLNIPNVRVMNSYQRYSNKFEAIYKSSHMFQQNNQRIKYIFFT